MTHAEIMEYLTRLEQAIKNYDLFKAQAIVKEFKTKVWASNLRSKANKFSAQDRQRLSKIGLEMIYGRNRTKTKSTRTIQI